MARVKASRLAGTWYAGDRIALERQTDDLLARAVDTEPSSTLAGMIVPHAAYAYSGVTAAAAYRCVRSGPYRRAVILAPSHYMRFDGAALLDVDAFATPLGEVAVDGAALTRIAGERLVRVEPAAYRDEHSLEIQLPLLQRVLPAVPIVPMLLGDLSHDDDAEFAGVLARLAGDGTIFIVSSDFTHYGERFGYLPFPAADPGRVRDGLRRLDFAAIERVLDADLAGFRRVVADTGATICGRVPIGAFLAWYGGAGRGRLLAYTTSLDLTGDFEHSVSYAALTFESPAG